MNEQIEKLADRADEYADQTVHYYMGQFDGLTWEGKTKQTRDKKFAELIVRECAKLNKKQYYELLGVIVDTEENDGFDDTCLDTVKRVAEYLGSDALIDHFGEKQ